MNRKLAFLVGLLLGASLVKLLRRRPGGREASTDPRAQELRRKLADTRAETGPAAEAGEAATPAAEEPPTDAGSEDVEGLRRRVYEEGRTAAEQMRRSAEEG